MSEVKKKDRFRSSINIVDYLCNRKINGYQNDYKHFTKKLFDLGKDLYKKDLTAHFGCVNAIEFSNDGNLLFSGGDDRRVLMWNVNDAIMYYTGKLGDGAKPIVMKANHNSNIFCLAVDDENKRVLSGSNDDQVIVHDYATGRPVDVFSHDSPIFSLSLHPNNGNIFASATENCRILIYDIRESSADLLCLAKFKTPFHGVMFNPCEPNLIATANSKIGVHIWDLRKPKEFLLKCNDDHSMAVRWNQSGTILLALRNLLPIVLYDPLVPKKKLEFDANTYFNACTMKSCCFAGDNDEYILSGSDDFNLYMWKVPDPWPESNWVGSEHLNLNGHRSIVNQVRYCSSKQLIATSGVEKIVKLWSTFRMPYSEGDLDKGSTKRHRVLCSSRTCATSPAFLSHDYSQESVEEDTRMIHFFDSLLQNELDDLTTFLFPSEAFANLFNLNRKSETRAYEKLVRRKKKYLSKILIDRSEKSKTRCTLYKNLDKRREPEGRRPRRFGDEPEEDIALEDSPDLSSLRQGSSSSDGITTSPTCSPSFSGCSTSNALSGANSSSDSHLSSELAVSDVASTSGQSKVSLDFTFSDTDDSNSNESADSKSNSNKLSILKDSGINVSDSSDTDHLRSTTVIKRKRPTGSRCYRNHTKRKRKNSTTSNSSGSKSLRDNKTTGSSNSGEAATSSKGKRVNSKKK